MLELLATNNFGDTREGSLAGPTGLVFILLLAVGTVLLIRNMNRRLRRLPQSFDEPAPTPAPDAPDADRSDSRETRNPDRAVD